MGAHIENSDILKPTLKEIHLDGTFQKISDKYLN